MASTPSRADKVLTDDIEPDLLRAGRKVSYEEFFEWAPESRIAEWVNGEIIMPSPPRFGHQDITDFLTAVLRIFTQAFDLGQIVSAPFQVKPGVNFPGREPDILFVAAPYRMEQDTPRLERAPDVVVEVMSPGTEETDRAGKYREYAAVGVREYWLINGWEHIAEFYRLDEAGQYELVFAGSHGVYQSEAIERFALPVGWLWQVPRPRPELVVLEIAGAEYAQEVLVAAANVLPAGELARALPAVLARLPAEVATQVLPEMLRALPADIVAQALPADLVVQMLPDMLTALPTETITQVLPAVLARLPAELVVQVLPDALAALPADLVVQMLPDMLMALPTETITQVLPAVLARLPAELVAQVLPDALTALPAETITQVLPDVLRALPASLLVDTLATLAKSLPPTERAKLRDTLS